MKHYFLGAGIIIAIVIGALLYKKPPVNPTKKTTIVRNAKTTNAEWKQILSPLEYNILREKGTEIPFTGSLLHEKRRGTYVTADCGDPVFFSEQKFDSKTGWPSFWAPIKSDSVVIEEDTSLGIKRFEVLSKCGGHLGHLFEDGPAPTGLRYCINSAALKFIPDKD